MITFKEFTESIVEIAPGETDGLCVICGELCTENSHCANRFMAYQGYFAGNPNEIEVIYFCDDCDSSMDDLGYDREDVSRVIFCDAGEFHVQEVYRMND